MIVSRALRLVLTTLVLALLFGGSSTSPADFNGRVRYFTRPVEFDYVAWTLDALLLKLRQAALGEASFIPSAEQSELVLEHLRMIEAVRSVEWSISELYSDPHVPDPDEASAGLRFELERRVALRDQLAPLAEAVMQAQVSAVLADLGLTLAGQPTPPVLYHVTAPPSALIISPRQRIEQLENISVLPDLTLEQITALEEAVAGDLDVSALVAPIGGVGIYPTMVMQTTEINFLAEVVAHEWVHNYLTLRPLGVNYLTSAELRTFNETVASIAGIEIGAEVIRRYYPEYAPPEVQAAPETQPQPETTPDPDASPEPDAFDFRAEMRETRLQVDELLANGQVEQAESYMEERRRFFWDNGYLIRKLNQAYFAFYGAYADSPGGAAGEDPVGAAVRAFRSQTKSLEEFISRVAWMFSIEQLYRAVEEG